MGVPGTTNRAMMTVRQGKQLDPAATASSKHARARRARNDPPVGGGGCCVPCATSSDGVRGPGVRLCQSRVGGLRRGGCRSRRAGEGASSRGPWAVPRYPLRRVRRSCSLTGEPLRTRDRLRRGGSRGTRSSRAASSSTASQLGDARACRLRRPRRAHKSQAEKHYGAVLEATSDSVSIADRDQNLVYINAGGRRMVGMSLDEDIWDAERASFYPSGRASACAKEAFPDRAPRRDWRARRAPAPRRARDPVSQVVVAHTGPDGEVDFYATIARDMTREQAAEAALRASEERFRTCRAGAGRHGADDLTAATCRSTTRTAGPSGGRARSSTARADDITHRRTRDRARDAALRRASRRSTASRSATSPGRRHDLGGAHRRHLPRRHRGRRSTSSGWCRASASAASRRRCSAA